MNHFSKRNHPSFSQKAKQPKMVNNENLLVEGDM